ncbi:type VII secretion protein EssA [Clostridium felsineum]|nr:type VII secretion protein EssA [Clostridium felsineum]
MLKASVSNKSRCYFLWHLLLKNRLLLFISMVLVIFLLANPRCFAEDNGSLQLNPNVITNSDGGIGTTSDFSIRSQLFTPTIDKLAKKQAQDNIPKQRETLDLSKQATNTLYNVNTTKVVKQLFVNYKPQVIASSTNKSDSKTMIWYWVISLAAIPLIVLAIFLGRKNAKRRLRKKNERTH